MTAPESLRALNASAYAAVKACRKDGPRPDINLERLLKIARETDAMVDDLKPEGLAR